MPAVPERYVSQVAAQANRRIIETPQTQADTSIGDALQHVGKVALEIQTRIQQSQQDQELVKAEREAKTRLDRLKYDLEADAETPDAAIPKRWMQESDAIIKETAAGISSEAARNLWTERAKGWQGEGENWSVGLQRKRSVDKVRAGHITAAAELDAKAGDLTVTAETYNSSLDGALAALKRDVDRGMIDADAAAQREAQLQSLRTKDIDLRTVQNVDALIEQGRVAEARAQFMANYKDMSPETRAKMDAGLKASEQDFAVVSKGDEIWDKAKGDYGKAIQMAAAEKDPATRLKLEQRLGQKQTQAKAAEEARQDGLQDQLWKHVVNGGTIMSASAVVRGAIDPNRLSSIRAYENARDGEDGMTPAQKAIKAQNSKRIGRLFDDMADTNTRMFMSGYDNWSPQTQALYEALDTSEQMRVDELVRKTKTEGYSGNAVSKLSADLTEVVKRWAPAEWRIGSEADPDKLPPQALAAKEMIRQVAQENAVDTGGKPLSDKQLQDMVIPIFRKLDDKRNWLEIPQVEMQNWAVGLNANMTVTGIDNTLWQSVKDRLTKANNGQPPSNDDVVAGYVRMGGKLPAGWN